LVTLLPRRSGEKEARYAHMLSGTPEVTRSEAAIASTANASTDRLTQLEGEVAALREELEAALERITTLEALRG
jgi:uncharacterized protein YceH (UPF0502 family)